MKICNLLFDIHNENFQKEANDVVFDQLLVENDFQEEMNIPILFIELLMAVNEKKMIQKLYRHPGSEIMSNLRTLLMDLADDYDWEIEDVGESVTLKFERSSLEATLMFECDGVEVLVKRL